MPKNLAPNMAMAVFQFHCGIINEGLNLAQKFKSSLSPLIFSKEMDDSHNIGGIAVLLKRTVIKLNTT